MQSTESLTCVDTDVPFAVEDNVVAHTIIYCSACRPGSFTAWHLNIGATKRYSTYQHNNIITELNVMEDLGRIEAWYI